MIWFVRVAVIVELVVMMIIMLIAVYNVGLDRCVVGYYINGGGI